MKRLHALYFQDEYIMDADTMREQAEREKRIRLTDDEIAEWAANEGWAPWTMCHICNRDLEVVSFPPLCSSCVSIAKAYARILQAENEWIQDGKPD